MKTKNPKHSPNEVIYRPPTKRGLKCLHDDFTAKIFVSTQRVRLECLTCHMQFRVPLTRLYRWAWEDVQELLDEGLVVVDKRGK